MRTYKLTTKIRKYINLTLIGGFLVSLLGSCTKESYSECPPAMDNVRIYLNLAAEATKTKSLWQTDQLDIFIFDQQGLFYEKLQDTDIIWSPNYYLSTVLPTGNYTFVAWTNLKENYHTQPNIFIKGSTTLDQAKTLLAVSQESGLIDFTPQSLYFGKLAQAYVNAGQQTKLTIPLKENTYRINFLVKGLEATNHHYNFTISDNNTAYYFDNTFAPSQEATYFTSSQMNAQAELVAHQTILRIDRTRNPLLKITDGNSGEELFKANLVAMILQLEAQGVVVDFDLTHDFDLEITLSRTESGITAEVSINGWKLIDEDGKLD